MLAKIVNMHINKSSTIYCKFTINDIMAQATFHKFSNNKHFILKLSPTLQKIDSDTEFLNSLDGKECEFIERDKEFYIIIYNKLLVEGEWDFSSVLM
jgi:hypothetical protein